MNKKGFTLIELLIVIAIIGIIAAIAIPNILMALQKSKQKRTQGDIKTIATGLASYLTDHGNFDALNGLQTSSALNGNNAFTFHLKKAPEKDGWGNDIQINYGANEEFGIGSAGKDAALSASWTAEAEYELEELADFNNDIIFVDSQFTYGPRTTDKK